MKIAYVININSSLPSGIIPKISEQIKNWKDSGCQVSLFDLCSTSFISLIDGGEILRVGASWGLFQRLKLQNDAALELKKLLKAFQPDIIYLRYMLSSRQLLNALDFCPFVIEINTDDTREFMQGLRITHYYNRFFRNQLLKRASGFVTVTHELAERRVFSSFNKATLTLANGIDVSLFADYNGNNEGDRVLFIGTPGCDWHGIDKIIQIAKLIPEKRFDIIGYSQAELELKYPMVKKMNNIIGHGFLSLEQSMKIAENSSVAISTLALHRTSLSEASPLKTRFYLALGLPIIIGYNDTDLLDVDLGFVLNIGNNEDNVTNNIQKIKDFILRSADFSKTKIVKFAQEHLSCHKKEKQRLDFFYEIIKSKSNL